MWSFVLIIVNITGDEDRQLRSLLTYYKFLQVLDLQMTCVGCMLDEKRLKPESIES